MPIQDPTENSADLDAWFNSQNREPDERDPEAEL
jgi:hypothetical protein